MDKIRIKKDGTFLMPVSSYPKSAIYVAGSMGGATAKLTLYGNDVVDGAVTETEQIQVFHGSRAPLKIEVTGFTAPFTVYVHALNH